MWRDREAACRVPAAPLAASLRDPRVIAFLLVWFGVNVLFGVFSIGAGDVDQAIAWQAHIGGFVTGLVAFAAFDPVPMGTGHGGDTGPDSAAGIH
jgi:membrane associated rhomboid family serine protease